MFLEKAKKLFFPLEDKKFLEGLRAGDPVLLSGWLLCARDATHKKLISVLLEGFPLDLEGQLLYYVGPSPTPPHKVIGSCGPTTSSRLDPYLPFLLERGLSATMGKGKRSKEARNWQKSYGALYLATFGGAGAYLSQFVEALEIVAFPELGPEALFRMKVKNFPAIVINDLEGRDFYEEVSSAKIPA